jgi:hypothetical protein
MARKATTTTKGVPARIKTAAIKGVEQGKTFASVEKALIAKGVEAKGLYQMIRRAAIEHYGSVEAVKAAKAKAS